jgi:hypothetical protein
MTKTNKIAEIFGMRANDTKIYWQELIEKQICPFVEKKCFKVRKSQPDLSIGTCSVLYSNYQNPIIICPFRLLERRQIFLDCLHLLTLHEPGNEIHIIPEITVPGGNVDYFVTSVRDKSIKDFLGLELQTIDTTGTVWPERQRFLQSKGFDVNKGDLESNKVFGMNWKMTAKTTLIQLHHKVQTFEHINKHLVLVIQDYFLEYLKREFQFSHLHSSLVGDPMHIHSYALKASDDGNLKIELNTRLSTDANGIAICLGLQAEAKVEVKDIIAQLEAKISKQTLFTF